MFRNRSFTVLEKDFARTIRWAFVSGLVIFLINPSFSQQKTEVLKFETVVLGLNIGDLNVKKYQVGDTLHYVAESKVGFWFFGRVDLEVFTHSRYVNGYFVKSESRTKTNRGDFASSIHWDGKKYLVDAKSYKFENDEPVIGLVKWCSTRAFFEQLPAGERFISEVFGLTTTIETQEPNVLSTIISGNENRYFYEKGELQKVTIEHAVKNFQYKRVP
ncbi:hypothetical protein GCM10009119_26690 [Algoriphagus jejuensis]|uniref:DKNYY family protein n=1 Tax=Algoriphagus jejuensis TaxID=419934 RepID=A0ABN1N256_9BACT